MVADALSRLDLQYRCSADIQVHPIINSMSTSSQLQHESKDNDNYGLFNGKQTFGTSSNPNEELVCYKVLTLHG